MALVSKSNKNSIHIVPHRMHFASFESLPKYSSEITTERARLCAALHVEVTDNQMDFIVYWVAGCLCIGDNLIIEWELSN